MTNLVASRPTAGDSTPPPARVPTNVVLAVGAVLLVVLVFGLGMVLRRRWVSRGGGVLEMSFREAPSGPETAPHAPGAVSTARTAASARGWTLGIGRYSDDVLECFRIFSLSPRPRRRLERCQVTYLGQREPQGMEVHALYAGHVVIACSTAHGVVELALAPDALTGLLAWLEAAPPGRHGLAL